ncbi:nucleotide-binding protein [Methanocalculus sp. MC3]
MKIGNITVRVTIIHLGVFVFFTAIFLFSFFSSGDFRMLLWGIPTLIFILTIPIAMNYMSQSHYRSLKPMYEAEAKPIRANQISDAMMGKVVRYEGLIEHVHFKFLNRPQYVIADRTGEVSVKMFTSPEEDVGKGDIVEVLGSIMRRYIITGDPIVNCVSIRKIVKETRAEPEKKEKKKR